jgi:hypothetical protein
MENGELEELENWTLSTTPSNVVNKLMWTKHDLGSLRHTRS